jgi:lipoprotein-anchoring transpeptidase ErfK/SrfK
VPTTTTVPPPPAWGQGTSGPEVAALQARLQQLGYWLDDEEGSFGSSTAHAVTAFQKRAGLDRDGVAGPVTLDALTTATRPEGQSTEGRVVEIDLDTQTLLLVEDGVVQWVFDTSTGARAGTTPRGHWAVYRAVDGYDHSPLGVLYRPKYFYEGVAVHGYPSVPPYPASHGCVRVLNAAMDYLWSTDVLARGTPVWVY